MTVAVAAKVGSIAMAVILIMSITVVVGIVSVVQGGDSYAWNPATDIAKENIPDPYLNAYLSAGRKYNVPWTLLAAVGMTASNHGQVDPYKGTPPSFLMPALAAPTAATSVNEVVVIGDSLTVGSKSALTKLATDAGLTMTIKAEIGKMTSEGIPWVKALPANPSRGYVIAMGTNDFFRTPSDFASQIDSMMKATSGAPTVWLTLDFEGDSKLNSEILAAANRHPNLVVVDWKAAATARGLTKADKYHYNTDGYTARAEFIMANLPGSVAPTTTATTVPVSVAVGASGPGAMKVPDEACPDVEQPIAGKPGQGVGPLLLLPNELAALGIESDPARLQNICVAADALAEAMAKAAAETETDSGANAVDLIPTAREGDTTAMGEILNYWTAVMDKVTVAGSTMSTGCAAPPAGNADVDQWTAHLIDRLWRCQLLDGDPAQRVTSVAFNGATEEFVVDPDRSAAADATIKEAKAIAWAFSQWGTAKCVDSANVAGVFPLTRQQFAQYAGELADRGRCDPEANITAAAKLFLATERLDPSKRAPLGSGWQAMAGGWWAFTGVLGTPEQRKKFATGGPALEIPLPATCKAEADARLRALAADPAIAAASPADRMTALTQLVNELKKTQPACPIGVTSERSWWIMLAETAEREPAPEQASTAPTPSPTEPAVTPTTGPSLPTVGTVTDPVDTVRGELASLAETRLGMLDPVAAQWNETPLVSRLASTPIIMRIPSQQPFGLPTGQTMATQWVNLAVQLGGLYEGDKSLEMMQGAYGSSEFGNVGSEVKYASLFNSFGAQFGVDPRLLYAVALQESDATPDLNCADGGAAYGMMQKEGGREVCGDVELQISEGARMLKDLIDAAGDNRGALWGYNNGMNFSQKWKEIGGDWEQAIAYSYSIYSQADCSQFTGGCEARAIRAMDYISDKEGAVSKLPPYKQGIPSAWMTYLELKEKYPGAVISAVQTSVSPGQCPTSVPAGTLTEGATLQLCAKSVALAATPEAAKAIIWAFNHLGIPYAWPIGMPRSGSHYDCSSFVANAYHQEDGANLPGVYPFQSTRDMFPWDGVPLAPYYIKVPPGQERPGDLGLTYSCLTPPCQWQHVQMVLADGFKVHTNTESLPSRVEAWAGANEPNFAGFRRVDPAKAR